MFLCFTWTTTDRFKHTVLPSFNLWSGGRHCVLWQGQRRRTVLQSHEILHGKYSLPHIHTIDDTSARMYVYNILYTTYLLR